MRSIFTPFTRLLVGGLTLAAAAAHFGCAVAEPRRSRGGGSAPIEEFGAPTSKGYDDIVVQLAPLVAAKSAKAVRPAEPAAVAAPPPTESTKSEPAAPVFLHAPLPLIESAPVAEVATAGEPDPVAPPAEPEAAAAAPQNIAAAMEEPAEPSPRAADSEATAESQKGEEPVAGEAAPPLAAVETLPNPAAAAAPAPLPEEASAEESESPLALWQALIAAFALIGLLGMKYVRRPPAAPAAQEKAAPAAGLAAAIAAMRAKIEPLRAKFLALRGRKPAERALEAPTAVAPNEAPKKPKSLDWAEVANALRARFGGAKTTGEPVAAQQNRSIGLVESEGRGRVADSWETSEEDGLELLEPGDASARAIVMNARRRLRAAQS
ncbi:hypothetical protein [Methylosinus sporium]|uniref:Uncharacterized protein n=1 Tax=Methylosinus sporium TaxID=428 RepID=A0A2U1SMW9_METSR|nr:hypothetical protein [Methylosinus sporium]PWB92962.1 hypothetical protein C5689_15305 [Methylosinus sporium]